MSTVHVSNIAPITTEQELRDFFSFCGRITALSITPGATPQDPLSASVTFERDTAAKTALLLDNTMLGPSSVKVEATHSLDDIAGIKATGHSADETEREHEIRQEDKPRTAILAEYLSHGYVIGDQALQRGKSAARSGLERSLSHSSPKTAPGRGLSLRRAQALSSTPPKSPGRSVRVRLLQMLAETPAERRDIDAKYPQYAQVYSVDVDADGCAHDAGIALDKQHGISSRFTNTLNKTLTGLDARLHATDRARAADSSYKITERAQGAQKSLLQYFEKALSTPTGMKIRQFYAQGEKQVLDIHNEARRLADLRKQEAAAREPEGAAKPATTQPAEPVHDAAQAVTDVPPATSEKTTFA